MQIIILLYLVIIPCNAFLKDAHVATANLNAVNVDLTKIIIYLHS